MPRSDPGICEYIGHIVKANGQYWKTQCWVNYNHNHDAAEADCGNYGMKLYRRDNDEGDRAVRSFAINSVGHFKPMWIDGQDDLCWFYNQNSVSFEAQACSISQNYICEYRDSSQMN